MRKGILAAIVAAALFAVGAFAATFNVISEDVASGADDVLACADDVVVDFDTGSYSSSLGDYEVTGAEVSFYVEDEEGTTSDCDGLDATLALGGGFEFDADEGINEGVAFFDFVDEIGVPAGEITVAAVLVEGFAIDTAPSSE